MMKKLIVKILTILIILLNLYCGFEIKKQARYRILTADYYIVINVFGLALYYEVCYEDFTKIPEIPTP